MEFNGLCSAETIKDPFQIILGGSSRRVKDEVFTR